MNLNDLSIVERAMCHTDVLIINQTDHEDYLEKIVEGHLIRMISTCERGLSRSRNMAIKYAKGDICLICDDDERLAEDYVQKILGAYQRHPEADIIAFNYEDQKPRASRKLILSEKRSSKWRAFPSVSLTFKREVVQKNELWFDLRFGAGSGIISAGEESCWQNGAVKLGLVRWECPDIIATVTQESSVWFKGYTEQYYYDLGANLQVNHPLLKYILQFYFVYRLRSVTRMPVIKQVKWMRCGMKGIKKNMGYKHFINEKES